MSWRRGSGRSKIMSKSINRGRNRRFGRSRRRNWDKI